MLKKYKNGNANVEIHEDGTRIIEYDGELKLEYPLNIDIRVSTKCSFGQKPNGDYVLCNFCHESAKTDGNECNYDELQNKLRGLPEGIELAIGVNEFTAKLWRFLEWCKIQGFICNITINQGHLKRDIHNILWSLPARLINGLGISYRSSLKWDVADSILKYPNTVFHVIVGIDTIGDIEQLASKGVKKILILGEKNFGFNSNKVDLNSKNHQQWFWWISKLFNLFEVVSFDNLALEQLNIKRFFNNENWQTFNQGEHSFYINAVDGYYAPSSRSNDKTNWNNLTIKEYYETLEMAKR